MPGLWEATPNEKGCVAVYHGYAARLGGPQATVPSPFGKEPDGRTWRAEPCQPPMTPDTYERVGGFARKLRSNVPFGLPRFREG